MSNFMDFLDNIDNDIINETYVDENTIQQVKTKAPLKKDVGLKKPNTIKKDSSVKLIEARIRTKLDTIGLNESVISDVVKFVLNDVHTISEIDPVQKNKPQQPKTVQENKSVNTILGRAESLLEGLPEQVVMSPLQTRVSEAAVESNMSDVASRASSLL